MIKKYPQRSSSHQLEQLSERYFINALPKNWTVQKPRDDYGVDLVVNIFEGNDAIGLELIVQLKSSHSCDNDEQVTTRLRTATYNHLWDKLQIVMLVKYIEDEDEAYWIFLSDIPKPSQDQNTLSIHIPKSNKVSSINWNEIHDFVHNVTSDKISMRRRNRFRRGE